MDDLNGAGVAVQDDPAARGQLEPDPASLSNGESTSVQSQQRDNGDDKLGPDNLPPELEETKKNLLRDYHEKTRKLSEDKIRFERDLETLKGESNTLKELFKQQWFQKAMQDEQARRNGRVDDIQLTDEQFEAVKNDKEAFKKLVLGMAERVVNGRVAPALGQTQQSLQQLHADREFERVASTHKDFRELNDKGALDSYLQKGMDFETAYKAYKFDNEFSQLDRKAQEKAQEILKQSRDGAVSQVGRSQIRSGGPVVKAKNFDDAFDKAFDMMKRGQKDFTMERE